MLFLRDDGFCHEEALIFCKDASKKHQAASKLHASAMQVAAGGRAGSVKCDEHPCEPVPQISLSYARSMIGGALAYRPTASRGLLIGVGAGMVPLWVQEARHSLQLDAVDVSDEVLNAAPCFGLRNDSNVRLWLHDGRKYIQSAKDTYDVVLLDVFTPKDKMPPCLSTLEFFGEVKSAMREGGVVAINTWRNEYKSVLATVMASFKHVREGSAPGESNHILLASDSDITHAVSSSVVKSLGDDVATWYLSAAFHEVVGDPTFEPRKDKPWCEENDQ
jgi:spermidine synthase